MNRFRTISWYMVASLAAVVIPYLMLALSKWYQIPIHEGVPIGPTDPDPWLRLTMVREWLTSGEWFNHIVANSNAPYGGIESPWTRPLDLVIQALVALQPDTVNLDLRLMRAALLLPGIWMTLLLLGVFRIARLFSPLPSVYLMAGVMIAAMPTTWNYFGIANADHHALLAVLFIWALSFVVQEKLSAPQSLILGAILALQLWVSFEAILLVAIIYVWFGFHWLFAAREKTIALSQIALSCAAFSAIALYIERGESNMLVPIHDSLSIVHVQILILATALSWVMRCTLPYSLLTRLSVVGLLSGVGMAILLKLFPNILSGPYAGLDPYITEHFIPRITETKPFYKIEWQILVATTYLPISALLLASLQWLRPRYAFYGKKNARLILYFIAATLALYLYQQRWSYYLLPATAAILAPVLAALFSPEDTRVSSLWPARNLASLSPKQQALRRIPILLAVIALPFGLVALKTSFENSESSEEQAQQQRSSCYYSARQLIRSGELNRALGNTPLTILASTDLGTEILFFTPHRIVASNYHRESAGIRYVWQSETITDPEVLKAHLSERAVDVVLLCPNFRTGDESLLAAYMYGRALPDWLERIAYCLPTDKDSRHTPSSAPIIQPLLLRVAVK